MNDHQLLRYSRHLLLNEFTEASQQRLFAARALVVGVGGLGCPALQYLAASGIGSITIVDGDTVDLTNLQRQVLHTEQNIGKKKVVSAMAALQQINPQVHIHAIDRYLDPQGLATEIANADVVLDCSDNFPTRYAINSACCQFKKPLVSGAAVRFSGQIIVFDQRLPDAPCYACLFPQTVQQQPSSANDAGGQDSGDENNGNENNDNDHDQDADEERCATMGVFAPLTGVIGCMQAAEAIKLLASMGSSLNGKILLFDALTAEWRTIAFNADPLCPVCRPFK